MPLLTSLHLDYACASRGSCLAKIDQGLLDYSQAVSLLFKSKRKTEDENMSETSNTRIVWELKVLEPHISQKISIIFRLLR